MSLDYSEVSQRSGRAIAPVLRTLRPTEALLANQFRRLEETYSQVASSYVE
jgi:hypothetical protein